MLRKEIKLNHIKCSIKTREDRKDMGGGRNKKMQRNNYQYDKY